MLHTKLEGIILKTSPFKEYDKVIVFFSPNDGVVRVIGKGVRRPRSQRSYHLDLFSMVNVELECSGKTTPLLYLREIHTTEHFKIIKGDPARYSAAGVIALFIYRMLPEGARNQQELYTLTIKALNTLNTLENTDPDKTVLTYLLKAVKLLGHLEDRMKSTILESELLSQLESLDPQFTLQARRTLSIFSSL